MRAEAGACGTDATTCRVVPDLCATRTRSGIHFKFSTVLGETPASTSIAGRLGKGSNAAPDTALSSAGVRCDDVRLRANPDLVNECPRDAFAFLLWDVLFQAKGLKLCEYLRVDAVLYSIATLCRASDQRSTSSWAALEGAMSRLCIQRGFRYRPHSAACA